MNASETAELKEVLQAAWVKGIRWFGFCTEGLDAFGEPPKPNKPDLIGSLNTAHWPFENVPTIGVTSRRWNRLDPAPTDSKFVLVDDVKVVWVGNANADGSSVWHGTVFERK